jgi:hypothetical protein
MLVLPAATSWARFRRLETESCRSALAVNQKIMMLRTEPHTCGEVFTLDTVTWDGRRSEGRLVLEKRSGEM